MDGGTGQGLGNGVSQESSRKFSQVLRSPYPGRLLWGRKEARKDRWEGGGGGGEGGREQEEGGGEGAGSLAQTQPSP